MEAALALPAAQPRRARFTFWARIAAAILLLILADRLFYVASGVGATIGAFALALVAAVLLARGEVRRRPPALLAAGAAFAFGIVMVDDPGLLALALFWVALSMAVLLPRAARFDSGWRWALRLAFHTAALPAGPIRDAARLIRNRSRNSGGTLPRLPMLILPLVGSAAFLILFAAANPLIDDAFATLDPLEAFDEFSILRLLFWLLVLLPVWGVLRPRLRLRILDRRPAGEPITLPGVSLASVTISLVAFNAIFALQNGLDLAFLWSGARLPDGMTLAEYAHRGAYPLIATALLAAGFVLVTLRPGTDMAASPLIRRLVSLWIAQNVFLVASTMLRTTNYIAAYSLTELRLQALVWMALVATGLVLICIRLWLGRSGTWLINANLLGAALVLSVSSAIDYDRIAAGWNVRHTRDVGGKGAALDFCYLYQMGPSALLPLIDLEARPLPRFYKKRVAVIRNRAMRVLEQKQLRWDGWTWRGDRRLAEARRLTAQHRLPRFAPPPHKCDGSPAVIAPPLTIAPKPLTAPAAR